MNDQIHVKSASGMILSIETTRLINSRYLLAEKANNKISVFASKLNCDSPQISQLIGKNPSRNIGGTLARRIEAAFGYPEHWLDSCHNDLEVKNLSSQSINKLVEAVALLNEKKCDGKLLNEIVFDLMDYLKRKRKTLTKTKQTKLIKQLYSEAKYLKKPITDKRVKELIKEL